MWSAGYGFMYRRGVKTMAGTIILELDTLSPDIVIYAPNYTTKSTEVEIVVQADETLSDGFQNFYVLDNNGVKQNYIFTYEKNRFVGKIKLSNFDNGIVTFYAQVKDEVHNLSALASKSIQIIPSSNYLRLNIDDSTKERKMELSGLTMGIESNLLQMENNMSVSHRQREISSSSGSRPLSTGSRDSNIEINTEVVTD
jgi:hypothetical protein